MSSAKLAYVTLLMPNEDDPKDQQGLKYLPGVLATAHSIRMTEEKDSIPFVCMVTPDVSPTIIKPMKNSGVEVVNVDYIEQPIIDTLLKGKQKAVYTSWMNKSFTKWQCLGLPYDKIVFLDADLIILSNIEHLFGLETPAGVMNNAWARNSPFLRDKHGQLVKANKMARALHNSHVITASCLVLTPDKAHLLGLKKMLGESKKYGHSKCFSGADEQSIVDYYSAYADGPKSDWIRIGSEYNFIPWKGEERNAHILHYFNKEKPWMMKRRRWEDLQVWYDVIEDLMSKTGLTAKDLGIPENHFERKKDEKCYVCKHIRKVGDRYHHLTECDVAKMAMDSQFTGKGV